jgi:hypothetical protein
MSYHHNLQRTEHALFLVFPMCLDDPKSPIADDHHIPAISSPGSFPTFTA